MNHFYYDLFFFLSDIYFSKEKVQVLCSSSGSDVYVCVLSIFAVLIRLFDSDYV